MIRLQNLQNNQLLLPRILNIMTIRLWEIRHITRQIIKRRSLPRRREQRRSTAALNEKSPFITRRMPMNLPQPSGFDSDQCSRKPRCDWEAQRVNDLDASAFELLGWLFGEVVRITLGLGHGPRGSGDVLCLDVAGCWCAGEDE